MILPVSASQVARITAVYQWLTTVILATWEAETGRIIWFKAVLGEKVTRPHLNQQLGTAVHACYPKLCGQLGSSWPAPAKKKKNAHKTLSQWEKNWEWRHALVIRVAAGSIK
jgi:hypothetical protein